MRSFAKVQWSILIRLLPARFTCRSRLRYIAALLVLGCIIAAASATAYISYQIVRRLILTNLEQKVLLEVKQRSDYIDRWIAMRKAEIEMLANTPIISSMNWQLAEPYLQSEIRRLKEFYHFASIDPDGYYYTTKVGKAKANVKDRQHFQKAMAGEVYVSDPTISRSLQNKIIIPISAPIYSLTKAPKPKTIDRPIGVMNGVILLERLVEIVGKMEYGSGSYTFILNSQGVPIVHPDPNVTGNIDRPAASFLESPDANLANIAREMVYQKTGISQTQLNNTRVYIAYLPLQQAEWSIALVIPRYNIEKELHSLYILAEITAGFLLWAILSAIAALNLFAKNQVRGRTEAMLHRLTGRVRASLNLDRILETTVEELGTLLHLERAIFGWYDPRHDALEFCWEYCREGLPPRLGTFGDRSGPSGDLVARLHRSESVVLTETPNTAIEQSGETAHLELVHQRYAAVPVLTQTNRLGYLFACADRQFAAAEEVEVLEAVADSLAIAISQSYLHEQIQEQLKLLEEILAKLRRTEEHLMQSEKMSVLGELAAGLAREINNPINFIYGNLIHVNDSIEDLLALIHLWTEYYPIPEPEIAAEIEALDLDFVSEDLPQILNSLKMGSDRIRQLVRSLQNFSIPDDADRERADIHEGIDSVLLLLAHKLENKISVVKEYSNLPLLLCYPSQLNQAFASILRNAIDAVNSTEIADKIIVIKTEVVPRPEGRFIAVSIANNGTSIPLEIQHRIFDPFFTTKSFNKFTGLGLSICYKIIVQTHGGRITVKSPTIQPKSGYESAIGAEFVVELPVI
ncbi:MAG: ATP-binding protein [Oscillatoriaceae cyanobacterium Prado104]|jgi:signal transduction histidine kinase|nr:ATP-binding protein [Oscillatoriaceae cyanobacterium Prado104]